jgi:hypothetical protein
MGGGGASQEIRRESGFIGGKEASKNEWVHESSHRRAGKDPGPVDVRSLAAQGAIMRLMAKILMFFA